MNVSSGPPSGKRAVFSMDVEDWYHLDYVDAQRVDRTFSMLDGVDRYVSILERHGIPSSFFVLGELARNIGPRLAELTAQGHDVGSHGPDHARPMTLGAGELAAQVERCKKELEDLTGAEVQGYRAPCFSINRERLELLRETGFKFDSSRILFGEHPLYEVLDVDGFARVAPGIYCKDGFFEFQLGTHRVARREIPVSGGGYLRILPWFFMKQLLRKYLARHGLYVLYIHPFELSDRATPRLPRGTPQRMQLRFGYGREGVAAKLECLIALLRSHGYDFVTFASLRTSLIAARHTISN